MDESLAWFTSQMQALEKLSTERLTSEAKIAYDIPIILQNAKFWRRYWSPKQRSLTPNSP